MRMRKFKKITVPVVAATFIAFGAGIMATDAAYAVTCQFGTETDFTASADVWTSKDCVGQLSGNDAIGNDSGSNVDLNNPLNFGGMPLFGAANWSLDTKIESNGTTSPSGILFASFESDLLSGDWSVSSWAGVGKAALVLKGGNGFAAYLLDTTAGLSGEWSTQALTVGNNNNQPALSHVSLYTAPTPIPLPAGGILLISALGGLGFAARRRRKMS